eukprot:2420033-Rhodomonas_salina.2
MTPEKVEFAKKGLSQVSRNVLFPASLLLSKLQTFHDLLARLNDACWKIEDVLVRMGGLREKFGNG